MRRHAGGCICLPVAGGYRRGHCCQAHAPRVVPTQLGRQPLKRRIVHACLGVAVPLVDGRVARQEVIVPLAVHVPPASYLDSGEGYSDAWKTARKQASGWLAGHQAMRTRASWRGAAAATTAAAAAQHAKANRPVWQLT